MSILQVEVDRPEPCVEPHWRDWRTIEQPATNSGTITIRLRDMHTAVSALHIACSTGLKSERCSRGLMISATGGQAVSNS
jgi:hypothetical protein